MNLGLFVAAFRAPASEDARATPAQASVDSAPFASERSFAEALAALGAGLMGLPAPDEAAEAAEDEVSAEEGEPPAIAPVPELPVRDVIPRAALTAAAMSAGETLEPAKSDESPAPVDTAPEGAIRIDAPTVAPVQISAVVGETPVPVAPPATAVHRPADDPAPMVSRGAPHGQSGAAPSPSFDLPVVASATGHVPGHTGQLPAAAAPRAGVRAFAHRATPESATPDLGSFESGPLASAELGPSDSVTDPLLATVKDEAATYTFEKRAGSKSNAGSRAEAAETAVPSAGDPFADSDSESQVDRENTRELPSPATRVAIDQTVAAAVTNRLASTGDAGPQSLLPIAGPPAMPRAAMAVHTAADPRGQTAAGSVANALASTLVPAQSSSLPGETSSQIVQSLRLQLSRGGGSAHIRLEPQYFGELNVSIRVDQGQVVARLEAEAPGVREWLQTNQAWLRSNLAEHNLTLDRIEVSEVGESRQGERRQGDASGSPREEQPRQRRRRPDTGEMFEVVA